ncbi:MAG: hypothetical protein RIC35_06250 [Marinoscillum sp.]
MKSLTLVLSVFLATSFTQTTQAQFKEIPPAKPINSISAAGYGAFGLGVGLPYGGLGAHFGYNFADRVNSFVGLGYNFLEFGFNIGLEYDFAIVNRTSFYASGMGGYNAVTIIQGLDEYNETFFGPSLGTGIKFNSKKAEGNYWQFGLILPFRNAAYRERVKEIEDDPRIEGFVKPGLFVIALGYHMGF